MEIPSDEKKPGGLYVLGSLYPYVTGGMEIFNYYFLNYRLKHANEKIFYPGEHRADPGMGNFILFRKRWPARFFYPFQFFTTVFKLRKKLDFAYISYAEQSWVIAYAHCLTLRIFKIPYIITIHWGKEPDWRFRFPFVSYFRHAHAVIGVSEPICRAFKKAIPGQEFGYIPPLIPFQPAGATKPELKKQLGYEKEEKILLFVGSLKAMKNPDKIVEAFREIGAHYLEEHPIRLILAGKGNMEDELKERIRNYGLDQYIRLTGLVSREKIPEYYKAADCYIISSDYEGTSLSLLEAMFNKLPIIASNAPGINRLLIHEQDALLYETVSIRHLAETIMRVFSDHSLAQTLSENAFSNFMNNYSYESMMQKYQSVFASVIN